MIKEQQDSQIREYDSYFPSDQVFVNSRFWILDFALLQNSIRLEE